MSAARWFLCADPSGDKQTFKPGDAFLLPRGFKGLWEMPRGMQKYYVVFDTQRNTVAKG